VGNNYETMLVLLQRYIRVLFCNPAKNNFVIRLDDTAEYYVVSFKYFRGEMSFLVGCFSFYNPVKSRIACHFDSIGTDKPKQLSSNTFRPCHNQVEIPE